MSAATGGDAPGGGAAADGSAAAGGGSRALGVGVIGLGFMGRQHIASYRAADADGLRNRLVAVADVDPARRAGAVGPRGNLEALASEASARAFDPAGVRAYADPHELLADPAVELVSVCTWTETHVELAAAALAAGKHVLVEKPVALTSAQAARLADAARDARTLCMPGMCMRFWPAWSWLHEAIAGRRFGAVRSAVFTRVGAHPGPAHPFYGDVARCGGALFDLHVHDADFVRFCFGAPSEVVCAGNVNHLTALYRYETPGQLLAPGAHVAAEGGWSYDAAQPFRMRFTVAFEGATADWDLLREPALLLAREGRHEPVTLPRGTGYDGEIRHLLDAIARGTRTLQARIDEAESLTRQLEAEAESLRTGRPERLRPA